MVVRAVLFDLGGVVFASPFAAFDVYESSVGLPAGSVRGLIRTSSETGAWAALERGELDHDEFCAALEAEGAAVGCPLDARALMATVGEGAGAIPEMLAAIATLRSHGLRVGALTNNWAGPGGATAPSLIDDLDCFDVVVESAKVGLRKPDPRFYEMACELLGVPPEDTVFLDDLGINLKPARAMGMTTIKVTSPSQALTDLSAVVGLAL